MSKQYVAIKRFKDLDDEGTTYVAGNIYPRQGVKVPDNRFAELASDKNKRKEPVIAEITELPAKETIEDKTVEQLKSEADEKGIEYKANIKKDDLIKLLEK